MVKARGFVLARDTGEPVPGVNVVARAKRNGTTTSLGLLTTDEAGYVSFDLSGGVDSTVLEEVSLEVVGHSDSTAAGVGEEFNGEGRASVLSTDGAVVLRVDPACVETVATQARAAVQGPDVRDWELSPTSFVTPRTVALGEGACTTPVRSTLPVHQIRFVQIVRRQMQQAPQTYPQPAPAGGGGSQVMVEGAPGRVDVSNPLLDPISPVGDVMLGVLQCEILEYEQTWRDVGESLGTILYSLPLAPCESVKIAIIEAERSDEAARSDAIDARESLTHSLFRDRNIAETVKGVLRESQGGSSFMAGQGAAYSGSWQNVGTFGVTHAIGYATSESWGRRGVEAKSAQDLHDSTVQATDFVRSLNSTVIVQGTQAERHQLETRTITNHNHCHALTVQYYEVLRRLKLETRFVGSRPGVLIPYQGLRFKRPRLTVEERYVQDTPGGHMYKVVVDPDGDDLYFVNRLRPMLEDGLLEPRLKPNFEAVRRLLFFDGLAAAAPAVLATPSTDYDIERIDATVLRGPEGTDSNVVKLRLVLNDQSDGLFKEEGKLTRKAKLVDARFWGYHKEYEDGEPLGPFKLTLSDPVRRSRIRGFEIHFEPTGGYKFSLRGLKVTARKPDGQEDVLVDEPSGREFEQPGAEPFSVTVPKPPELPDPETTGADKAEQAAAQRAQDLGLAWELITHLHDHRDIYGAQLAALREPMWFAEMLDWAMGRGAARDNINPVPVAISAQHIAFPYHGADANSRPPLPGTEQPPATIVSLPTRGVLAEAQLGSCNACEKRDVTRFWKWEESPCEQAPAIEGITPGFRGQPSSVEQGQLPNAVVQITQPPAAPDPVGLAAALNLLGKGDAFRNMSGLPELQQLLSGLASGAVDLVKAKQLAQQVQAKQAAQDGGANSGSGGTAPKQSPSERYDNLQVAREVAAQADSLRWSPKTTEAVTSGIVGDGPGLGQIIPAVAEGEQGSTTGAAALKAVADVTTDVVKNVVKEFLSAPDLKMDAINGGAALLSNYPKPEQYAISPPPRNMARTIYVQFDNLGSNPLQDGFNGRLDISWVDDCYLRHAAMSTPDKKRYAALQRIACKTAIHARPKGTVDSALSLVTMKLDLDIERTAQEWEPDADYYGNIVLRPKATLLITLMLKPKFVGGTVTDTIPVDLDIMRGARRWIVIQESGDPSRPFDRLEFGEEAPGYQI